jgi:hypothetical protein
MSLVYEPSHFKVEIATEKLERYKSPDIHKIPSELILRSTNLLILLGTRKICHSCEGNPRSLLANGYQRLFPWG